MPSQSERRFTRIQVQLAYVTGLLLGLFVGFSAGVML